MLEYDQKEDEGKSRKGQMANIGSADHIKSAIRQVQDLGVTNQDPSFHGVAGLADSLDAMLRDMEDFATDVVPKV